MPQRFVGGPIGSGRPGNASCIALPASLKHVFETIKLGSAEHLAAELFQAALVVGFLLRSPAFVIAALASFDLVNCRLALRTPIRLQSVWNSEEAMQYNEFVPL